MRPHIRNLVESFSKLLDDPIYEIGSYIVDGQEELANLRSLFPNKEYLGLDMREGPGVDIVIDICKGTKTAWRLPHRLLTTVLMLDTIEHVEYPHRAVENIRYNMAADSIFLMTGPFYFKIHDYPSDYWRFTPAAFQSLLKPFDLSICIQVGQQLFPHTIVGVGLNGSYKDKALEIGELLREWRIANEK